MINRIQNNIKMYKLYKKYILSKKLFYMYVCCIYLLCIYKYTHMHVYISEKYFMFIF